MKTKNCISFLFIALALIISSCGKSPVVNFDMSTASAEVGEEVSFTNNTTKANSYDWDFGDGSSSTETNPTHKYTASGTYTVSLNGHSSSKHDGFSSGKSKVITINDTRNMFSATIAGSSVQYIIETTNPTYAGLYISSDSVPPSGTTKLRKFISIIAQKNSSKNQVGISLGYLRFTGSDATTSSFNSFLTIKSYDYSINASDGVVIAYIDANGTSWKTSGSQTGSAFKITSAKSSTSSGGIALIEFSATFNCTLYSATGASKILTNGYMHYFFEN